MNKKHKKVLRRTCSFILTMVLLFSVSITAMARSFEDVTDYSREYQDAISFVADNGYMVGVDEDSFLPEGKLTRGMVVTLLHNMAGKPECSNTIPFTDVTTSDWFYNGVRWAYANGLVSGNGVDKFAPNDYIKKQDATLILYKYAIYCGMDVDDTCSLSEYTDASSVDSYALTAVKWAVEREIFPTASGTSLEPQASLTRAQMALMITKYGLNVEHIVYGRDNYSFNNSYSYFTDENYYISDTMYNKLYGHISAYYEGAPNTRDIVLQRLYDFRNRSWGGSCYGMAITTILDKLGKIDINGNYASDASTVFQIQGQEGGVLESAINYYQIAQVTPFLRNTQRYNDAIPLKQQLQQVVEDCMKNDGLTLFSYWWYGSNGIRYGHSIVAYDIVQKSNGDYELSAYDNRDTVFTPIIIKISKDFSSCIVCGKGGNEEANLVEAVTDFSAFDHVDIDVDMNDMPAYSTGVTEVSTDFTVITVEMTTDFTITNAAGKQLIYKDGRRSGDMAVYNSIATTSGEEVASSVILYVEASDSFTFEPVSDKSEVALSIHNEVGYASVNCKNVESIVINEENRMFLNGDDIEYEILYDNGTNDIEVISNSDVK